MSHVRGIVAAGGAAAVLSPSVLLLVQIPAASSLSSRTARGVALHKEAVLLAGQADSDRAITAATQQRTAETTAKARLLARSAKRQRATITALRKQVSDLQRDVKALGG